MPDQLLAIEIVSQIEEAVGKIVIRFEEIRTVDDFNHNPSGILIMDSICMQLIVTGELLKKLDKTTAGELLGKYPQVEWKKVMAMRDIITHHYTGVDANVIYNTCKNKIPELLDTIRLIKRTLNN